jgi:hypothetical protein
MYVLIAEKKTRQGLPVTNEAFLQVLELHAGILQQILSTVLNIIMFDECRNTGCVVGTVGTDCKISLKPNDG